MSWVKINNRLLEMEKNPIDSEEFRKEWNALLSTPIAGILKRNKYEEPKGKGQGKKRKKEEG